MELNDLSDSKLYRSLLRNPDMVQEILDAYNIRTSIAPLGKCVAGFAYCSRRGNYYIFGNEILGFEALQFVFLHELYHILRHMDGIPHCFLIDNAYEEMQADALAEVALARDVLHL